MRYPFGEYHQAFVPDFNAGAMENPGCVTLRDQFIYRGRATRGRAGRPGPGTVAHEMAHMWFGDLVTMRWWDDLWLNESFAEYAAHRCCTEGTRYPLWTEFGIVRKDWGSVADQSPSTHPVAGNGAADADSALQDFDGISYAKGAAVLKQLVGLPRRRGVPRRPAGLLRSPRVRQRRPCRSARRVAAGRRGRPGPWAADWLQTSGPGHPVVARRGIQLDGAAGGRRSSRPHAIAVGQLDADGPGAGAAAGHDRRSVGPRCRRIRAQAALVVPDADDDTWAKIVRFDAVGQVLEVCPAVPRAATRVVVVNAFRDAVRNAELDPAVALAGLLARVASETRRSSSDRVLRFCSELLAVRTSTAGAGPRRLPRVQETAAACSPPPSRARTVSCSASASPSPSARTPSAARWLDGRDLPSGLALDPELAWSVVVRLAEVGGDTDAIERR